MTNEELIADINERIDRGIKNLHRLEMEARRSADNSLARNMPEGKLFWTNEIVRLQGKTTGLKLVKDWMRAYQ